MWLICWLLGLGAFLLALVVCFLLGWCVLRLVVDTWDVDSDDPPRLILGVVVVMLLAFIGLLLGPGLWALGCAIRNLL